MLSAEQRAEFESRGLLRLPGFLDARVVADLRTHVLAFLRERRLVPEPPPPGFTLHASHTASLTQAYGFEPLWGAAAPPLSDDLLGPERWQRPDDAGQVLPITFPLENARWTLPHKVWHLDYMAPSALEHLPGLQLFLCLDRIEAHGGGTLVACGTHRLIDALRRRQHQSWPGRSADVRARLKASVPWLRELGSVRDGEDREARFMREATPFEDARLQVVELTGEPGDVFAMHPWSLHAPAANCGTRPRLALTQRLRARSL